MSREMAGCFNHDVNSVLTHVLISSDCDAARVCDTVFLSPNRFTHIPLSDKHDY